MDRPQHFGRTHFTSKALYVWRSGRIEFTENSSPAGAIQICHVIGQRGIVALANTITKCSTMRDFGNGEMMPALPGLEDTDHDDNAIETVITWSDELKEATPKGLRIYWVRK